MSKRDAKKKVGHRPPHPNVEAYNDLMRAYKEAFPGMSHLLFCQTRNFVIFVRYFCKWFIFSLKVAVYYVCFIFTVALVYFRII